MVDVIHIHEDDWGMRNLYPLSARAEAEKDLAEAAAAAERNLHPSGFGYTDIYMATSPSTDYTAFGLSIFDVEQALTPILPRVRMFNATVFSAIGSDKRDHYGSYEEDAWCFGLGNHCYLKFDTKGTLVSRIWFDLGTYDANEIQRFRNALEAIDALVPTIIIDYFLDFAGVVSDPNVVDHYIDALTERQRAAELAVSEHQGRYEEVKKPQGMFKKLFAFFSNRSI